jgi:hypothetical protein
MGECTHFRFNKCPIYTHDGASAKFSTNLHEMDNSVCIHYSACSVRIYYLCNKPNAWPRIC